MSAAWTAVVAADLLVREVRSARCVYVCLREACGDGGGDGVATGDKRERRKGGGATVCFLLMSWLSWCKKWEVGSHAVCVVKRRRGDYGSSTHFAGVCSEVRSREVA